MAKLRFRWRWIAGVAAISFVLCWTTPNHLAVAAPQQQFPSSQGPAGGPPFGEAPDPNDPMQRQRMQKMEKARNVQRQRDLVRDTDKLLALAKELKEQVNESNKDTLSVDVVKKAAEIEKLAKSVKDRMRG